MTFRPLSVDELLACLHAGWPCRWLPNSVSGRRQPPQFADVEDMLIEERCLYLDRFCDDDHPDLDLCGAVDRARQQGLIYERETRYGIREIRLTDAGRARAVAA